jgi:hypothetical protein
MPVASVVFVTHIVTKVTCLSAGGDVAGSAKVGTPLGGDLGRRFGGSCAAILEELVELSALSFVYVSSAVNMILDRFVTRR